MVMTAKSTQTVDEFTTRVAELLKLAWGEDWGEFIHDEPTGNDPEEVSLPKITYDTGSRRRSTTHTSLQPVVFEKKPDPNNPGQVIEVCRQWFDVMMIFKFYHTTNKAGRQLMNDFEDFLLEYRGHFRELGVSEIVFDEEPKPVVVTKWGKSLPERALNYLVRIERVTTIRSKTLQVVDTVVVNPKDNAPLDHRKKLFHDSYRDQVRESE